MKDFGRFALAITACSLVAVPALALALVFSVYCLLPDWPDINQR